jgi:AcrR family transcriptional regulator
MSVGRSSADAPPAASAEAASDTTRRTTKGERTRRAIMVAATDLFRDRGFRETSLADIGAAAGVSGPAIYRYFTSKGELLSVLIEQAAIDWREAVDEVLDMDVPPSLALERLIDAAVVLQLRNGNLRDVFNKEYRSLDDDARRRVARIERVRMAEWVHLLSEVHPGLEEDEARAVVTMIDGMLRSITTLRGIDRAQLAQVMKAMVFGGVRSIGERPVDEHSVDGRPNADRSVDVLPA